METNNRDVHTSAAHSPSTTETPHTTTDQLSKNNRNGSNREPNNWNNRRSSEVSSSAFTESHIFNQSTNEALIGVLRKRGVPEEIYIDNVARMNRRKNMQTQENLEQIEQKRLSGSGDLANQLEGAQEGHINENYINGTPPNDCEDHSYGDRDQESEHKPNRIGSEEYTGNVEKNKYSHFEEAQQDTHYGEHSDISSLDEHLQDLQGEYNFDDIESLIDSNEDDEEYQERSSELDFSDDEYEYTKDGSPNRFDNLYVSNNGRIVSAEQYMNESDHLKQYVVITKRKVQWKRVISLICMIFLGLLFFAHSVYQFQTVKYLDKQIHEIYRDRMELDKTVSVILQQVESKMKSLFHGNRFNNTNNSLASPLNITEIELNVYKQVESGFLHKLADYLPTEIPVIIKRDPGDDRDKIWILPEFEQLLRTQMLNLPPGNNSSRNALELDETLQKTMNEYIKEVLLNEYQFVDKQFFMNELYKNINDIKALFLHESEKFSSLQHEYSLQDEVFVRNLIQQEIFKEFERKTLYSRNAGVSGTIEQEKDKYNELNYATFSSGTRIMNHLCSPTFKGLIDQGIYSNEIGPIELLRNSEFKPVNDHVGNNEIYWFCDISKKGLHHCQWTARFKQPIYLHKIAYQHGRFKHNLSLMNSAPNTISLYVKIQDKTNRKQLMAAYTSESGLPVQVMQNDNSFIKVCNMTYDTLNLNEQTQFFQLPIWFLKQKPLVKSVSFVVENNYGNPYYIALSKFVVNGFTPYDLKLMALSDSLSSSSSSSSSSASNADSKISGEYRSFGDDDEVI
ncbi:hypothetical protein ACO0QE_001748 [Hanseniaspora vineae]